MKNNFSLKFNIFDILIAILAILISVSSIIIVNYKANSNGDRIINIQYQNTSIAKINYDELKEDMVYVIKKEDYPDLYGDFTVEISIDKGVRVHNITCPNHTCEKYGYISKKGKSIVCIPNGVIVSIESESIDDVISVG